MSDVARETLYELERAVHSGRHETGARAIYEWLCARRDELNAKWPGMSGDDLLHAQGEARGVAKLIKVIVQGPRIKELPLKPTEAARD